MKPVMAKSSTFSRWHKAVVLGLGASGYSSVRYLSEMGIDVSVQDSRDNPPYLMPLKDSDLDLNVQCGSFDLSELDDADLVVVSPGVSLKEPLIKEADHRGIEILGDIELFARACTKPVIGITGSNGKTTVTTIVGELLKDQGIEVIVAGNIGKPVLETLKEPTPEVYVLELSSFQLETTSSLDCVAAAILNISADHMDRYENLENYLYAKLRILKNANRLLLCRDDPVLSSIRTYDNVQTQTFGLNKPPTTEDYGVVKNHESGDWIVRGESKLISTKDLSVTGKHNELNIVAAIALMEMAGYAITSDSKEKLKTFIGLPHRCERILDKDGIVWINDSKSTNPGSTIAALSGIDKPIILIAGGQSKGADFTDLANAIQRFVRQVILIGVDRSSIAIPIDNRVPVTFADDLQQAVLLASRWAQHGDAVLLSPACASFDMFSDFEERGNIFRKFVGELPQ